MANLLLNLSLAISFLGIFLLLILANFSQVSVSGRIISIKSYDDFKIIKLDNNITLTCDSCHLKPNQTLQVTGKLTYYKSQPQVQADKIKILKNAN